MEIVKGNWLGFETIFYHEKTGKYSTNINDVIDYTGFEIDKSGLAAYLDFGYCVFGHTPIQDVKYILPHQVLSVEGGKVSITEQTDTTVSLLGKKSQEDDVMDMIRHHINTWADSIEGDILIPTSGGFDSRLLNVLLHDKSRIHSYTYGTSHNQGNSREVVYARELSKRLQTRWKRVDLGAFNAYQDEWFDVFGCSVGSFGTYHMEFYKQIRKVENRPLSLLSGIIGDAWAGSMQVKPISSVSDYHALGYTHQMHADAKRAIGVDYLHLAEPLFDRTKDFLKEPKYRILAAMRTKMILLQSLISIPNHYDFAAYSPFIDEQVAMSMLGIDEERRSNRAWQRDFFRKNNVLFEEEKHSYTYQNSLNYYSLTHHDTEPLQIEVLREVLHVDYLEHINRKLQNIHWGQRFYQTLMHTPKVKGVMKLMGFRNPLIQAYFAYLAIKPIEKLLLKRNQYVIHT